MKAKAERVLVHDISWVWFGLVLCFWLLEGLIWQCSEFTQKWLLEVLRGPHGMLGLNPGLVHARHALPAVLLLQPLLDISVSSNFNPQPLLLVNFCSCHPSGCQGT